MSTNYRGGSSRSQDSSSRALSLIKALGVRTSSFNPFFDEGHKPISDNKFGTKDRRELNMIEAALTPLTIQIALKRLENQRIGIRQLKIAHKEIFGDIYPWAGQLRTIHIAKNSEFTGPELIEKKVNQAFSRFYQLNSDNGSLLEGLGKRPGHEVGKAIALLYNDLNKAHPFLDGNGRSMRAVCTALARKVGYDLDWTKISDLKQTWDQASERAKTGASIEPLVSLFQKAITLIDTPIASLAVTAVAPSRREVARIINKVAPR